MDLARVRRLIVLAAVGGTAACALGVVLGEAAEVELTLDAIFGGDLFKTTEPDQILWRSDGAGFLFRDEIDGVEGLWEYDVEGRVPNRIMTWDDLEGRLARLRPRRENATVDDPNRHPKVGNRPELSPDGTLYMGVGRDDLYLLRLATGQLWFLTDDPQAELYPSFSQDGRKIAFVRDGDLYWVDVGTGAQYRLTDRGTDHEVFNGVADWVHEEELGIERSFWWSPRGDRILFVQYDLSRVTSFPISDAMDFTAGIELQSYPRAGGRNAAVRLGVVDLEGGAVSWIPTGVGDGYIARAGWHPDGRRVWFQVLDRPQTRLELRIADPGAGSSRLLVAEEDDAWVNVRDDLLFVDDERFVWSSERDGWRHLYLYGVDGRLIRRLTDGQWQVEEVYGSDAQGQILFEANAEDPRERHVYAVTLGGGTPHLLTPGAGTHHAKLSPDGRHFLDTWSTVTTPPRVDLYDTGGRLLATVDAGEIAAMKEIDFQPPEFGSIAADDGETLYTWMFRPPALDPARRYPALVYVYGGPREQEVVNEWGGTRFLYYNMLARKGLIVFCVDNRGSWGRGHAFETAIHRRLGEAELEDQLAGVRYLKSLPYVDGERIGVYGGSYGGYMALLCMLKAPEQFSAGIAYAPVTDWRLYDTIYTERYMGLPAGNVEGYRVSAPLNFAGNLAGPLLICHGTMDNNVHLQHPVQMVDALIREGRLFELMLYPRVRHAIRLSESRLHFHRLKTDFLERHLIGGGPR